MFVFPDFLDASSMHPLTTTTTTTVAVRVGSIMSITVMLWTGGQGCAPLFRKVTIKYICAGPHSCVILGDGPWFFAHPWKRFMNVTRCLHVGKQCSFFFFSSLQFQCHDPVFVIPLQAKKALVGAARRLGFQEKDNHKSVVHGARDSDVLVSSRLARAAQGGGLGTAVAQASLQFRSQEQL